MSKIPKNKEAEQLILGSLLLNGEEVAPKVAGELTGNEFYWKPHRIIYRAIINLHENQEPIEIPSLVEKLKKNKKLESANGRGYIADLLNKVVTSANIDHYVKVVNEKATMRRLLRSGQEITELARQEDDLAEILDKAEQKVFDVTKDGGDSDYTLMSEKLKQHLEHLEELHHSRSEVINGIPTGFSDLDHMLSGLKGGNLITMAGRPGMGKTGLALAFARNMALDGYNVGIFSLEMEKNMIQNRLLCGEARVNLQRTNNGDLSSEDFGKIASAANKFQDTTIAIEDTPHIPVVEVRTEARRMKAKDDVDIIMVDYLQLMQGSGQENTREQEVSKMTRSLKALAMELSVPVVAVSQLNREAERRQDKRPNLADLRESGAIEQDSNKVLLLYRDGYYEDEGSEVDPTEVIVAKQRNGPTGKVTLAFHKAYASFYEQGPRR